MIKIPPFFLTVKYPKEECKQRKINEKCFRQVVKGFFDHTVHNLLFCDSMISEFIEFMNYRCLDKIKKARIFAVAES